MTRAAWLRAAGVGLMVAAKLFDWAITTAMLDSPGVTEANPLAAFWWNLGAGLGLLIVSALVLGGVILATEALSIRMARRGWTETERAAIGISVYWVLGMTWLAVAVSNSLGALAYAGGIS